MPPRPQTALIDAAFGPRADAYVTSLVHAAGADLEHLGATLAALKPARVLDMGTGGGHAAYTAAPHAGEVVACDLSPRMLAVVEAEAARRGIGNLRTIAANVADLPFPAGHFDAVVSRYSAHHWDNLAPGLAEAARVLRPGGLALFYDAASPGTPVADTFLQAIELLRDPSHVRDHSASAWCAALAGAGFALRRLEMGKLRLDFPSWIARIATPPEQAASVRALQLGASDAIRAHYAIEEDGSFLLDTIAIEAGREAI